MADLGVQRKAASNIWAWVFGLVVIAIVLWVAFELITEDEVTPMVVPADQFPAAPGAVEGDAIGGSAIGGSAIGSRYHPAAIPSASIREVLADPGSWVGRPWAPHGEVTASEIVSDRGFWIVESGSRLFVVLNGTGRDSDVQGPAREWPAIAEGDVLRIERATLHEPEHLGNVSGEVDERTSGVVETQRIFAATDAGDVGIVRRQ